MSINPFNWRCCKCVFYEQRKNECRHDTTFRSREPDDWCGQFALNTTVVAPDENMYFAQGDITYHLSRFAMRQLYGARWEALQEEWLKRVEREGLARAIAGYPTGINYLSRE